MFHDRRDAGRALAPHLRQYAHAPDVLVLALPRGGVPVAYEVAQALAAPLDVLTVRKLGAPSQPELAIGAVASGGLRVVNQRIVGALRLSEEQIEGIADSELQELGRREAAYRVGRMPLQVKGRTVILIDDGLATGASMRVAVHAVRSGGAKRVVVAVPVAPGDTCEMLRSEADEVVCVETPRDFRAVGQWYRDFSQTTDEEVAALLRSSS
jgi:predicted phosphoribosyltransferase